MCLHDFNLNIVNTVLVSILSHVIFLVDTVKYRRNKELNHALYFLYLMLVKIRYKKEV